jgi:hypothetical protein
MSAILEIIFHFNDQNKNIVQYKAIKPQQKGNFDRSVSDKLNSSKRGERNVKKSKHTNVHRRLANHVL